MHHLVINHIILENDSYFCCFTSSFIFDTFPCTHTTKILVRPRLKTTKTFLLQWYFYIFIWARKKYFKTLKPFGYVFMKLKIAVEHKSFCETEMETFWGRQPYKFTFMPGYGLNEQTATQHVSLYILYMHALMHKCSYIHIYTHSCDVLCIYHEYMDTKSIDIKRKHW